LLALASQGVAAVAREDLMLAQIVVRLSPMPPVLVMAVIITTEINPAIIPYSIAVAPSSSRRNRVIELSMIYPLKIVNNGDERVGCYTA